MDRGIDSGADDTDPMSETGTDDTDAQLSAATGAFAFLAAYDLTRCIGPTGISLYDLDHDGHVDVVLSCLSLSQVGHLQLSRQSATIRMRCSGGVCRPMADLQVEFRDHAGKECSQDVGRWTLMAQPRRRLNDAVPDAIERPPCPTARWAWGRRGAPGGSCSYFGPNPALAGREPPIHARDGPATTAMVRAQWPTPNSQTTQFK